MTDSQLNKDKAPNASAAQEPLFRIEWTDPTTGVKGYAVVYSLMHGICGGGLRMRPGCTMKEVEGLARTMAIKKGLTHAVGGGAKGGIDYDPAKPDARQILKNFVTSMSPLYTAFWSTGEDMGVRQEVLNEVFEELGLGFPNQATINRTPNPAEAMARMSAGRNLRLDGEDLSTNIGGYGVAEAAGAAAACLGWTISERRAVLQGFGSMGGAAARYLARLGFSVIGISDAECFVTNNDGLDVEKLFATRSERGEIDRSALGPNDKVLPRDDCLTYETDLFVPAALGEVINEDNVDLIPAKLVVEAANLACTPGARRRLHERGKVVIPDFVANSATAAWFTWTTFGEIGGESEDSLAKVRSVMSDTVRRIFDMMAQGGIGAEQAAAQVADENIREMNESWGQRYPVISEQKG